LKLVQTSAHVFFLENLKVFLTILVVLHHAAITYGADGGWFYQEVKHTVLPDSVILTMFAATNQSFFMGLFFFISGCFVATSLAKKTARQFLMDKLIRLGIPVLLFVVLIYPLTIWVGYYPFTFASFTTDFPRLLTDIKLEHTGPAWFVAVLLIFNLIALVFKSPLIKLSQTKKTITGLQCLIIAFAIGAISFATRLVFPDGFVVLNVQLSYMPQYVFYFFAGVVLSKTGVTKLAESQKIMPWLIPSLVLLGILTAAVSILLATEPFRGGTNPYSIFYSFTQGFQSVGFSLVCLILFYRRSNQSPWWGGYPARAAYGAFFIHALVLVALTIALKPLVMAPILKFLLLGLLGVPASFVCGYWLTRLPLLRRVF
jgi:hypothetical protein